MSAIEYQPVQDYLKSLVPPRETELQKMEEYAEKNRFPIIGPVCGYYCYQLARVIHAKSIFELGSGYGYSRPGLRELSRKMEEAWCITPSGMKSCRSGRSPICLRWDLPVSFSSTSQKR